MSVSFGKTLILVLNFELGSKSSVVPPSFIKTLHGNASNNSDTDDDEDDYIIPNAHSPPMASRLTIGSRGRSKSESKLDDTSTGQSNVNSRHIFFF